MKKEEVAVLATSDYLKDHEQLALLDYATQKMANQLGTFNNRARYIYAYTKYYKHKDYFVAHVQTFVRYRNNVSSSIAVDPDRYPVAIKDIDSYLEDTQPNKDLEEFCSLYNPSNYFVIIGPKLEDFIQYKKISHKIAWNLYYERTYNPYKPIYPRKGDIYGEYHRGFWTLSEGTGREES